MIQLTRWDGESILVNPEYIVAVGSGEDKWTTLLMDSAAVKAPSTISVMETVDVVAKRCNVTHRISMRSAEDERLPDG